MWVTVIFMIHALFSTDVRIMENNKKLLIMSLWIQISQFFIYIYE